MTFMGSFLWELLFFYFRISAEKSATLTCDRGGFALYYIRIIMFKWRSSVMASRRRRKGLSFYDKKEKIKPGTWKEVFSYIFWIFAVSFAAFVIVLIFGIRTLSLIHI